MALIRSIKRSIKNFNSYERKIHCHMFVFILVSSHIMKGLLTRFACATLGNTEPRSSCPALTRLGCTKTVALSFGPVWPSHLSDKLLLSTSISLLRIKVK